MPIITSAEKLIIYRRRKGWTQAQAAQHFGVSRTRYQRWEQGLDIGPRISMAFIKPLERYYIYRLREGWSQTQLGKKMHCSRSWIMQMEKGDIPHHNLARFWMKFYASQW